MYAFANKIISFIHKNLLCTIFITKKHKNQLLSLIDNVQVAWFFLLILLLELQVGDSKPPSMLYFSRIGGSGYASRMGGLEGYHLVLADANVTKTLIDQMVDLLQERVSNCSFFYITKSIDCYGPLLLSILCAIRKP